MSTITRLSRQESQIGLHAVLPDKRAVYRVSRVVCRADNQTGIINSKCRSITASERAQVLDPFFPVPKERMGRLVPRHVRYANDLAAAVDPKRVAVSSAECADIHHLALVPKERVGSRDTCC